MTNYDAIKQMSVHEMAAMFYMLMKPMMDAFEISKEQKDQIRENIKVFLNHEITN